MSEDFKMLETEMALRFDGKVSALFAAAQSLKPARHGTPPTVHELLYQVDWPASGAR
jgi:hypothetical protein